MVCIPVGHIEEKAYKYSVLNLSSGERSILSSYQRTMLLAYAYRWPKTSICLCIVFE